MKNKKFREDSIRKMLDKEMYIDRAMSEIKAVNNDSKNVIRNNINSLSTYIFEAIKKLPSGFSEGQFIEIINNGAGNFVANVCELMDNQLDFVKDAVDGAVSSSMNVWSNDGHLLYLSDDKKIKCLICNKTFNSEKEIPKTKLCNNGKLKYSSKVKLENNESEEL